jgi:hypothetical protein
VTVPTPRLDAAGYGEGVYRRRIDIRAPSRGAVTADLEDDFHHFGVVLTHDGTVVKGVEGRGHRFPWSTCAAAAGPLAALAGMPLAHRSTAAGQWTDPRANCTHMFDLAGLAVAHAAAGRSTRVYDIAVPDRVDGRTTATLLRDGQLLLDWEVDGNEIVGPAPYGGVPLRAGFLAWAEASLELDLAEAAIVLRRATAIAFGRAMDLDTVDRANELPYMLGTCYSFGEGTIDIALRQKGSTRDFTDAAGELLVSGAADL